jgi:hypothetical protein
VNAAVGEPRQHARVARARWLFQERAAHWFAASEVLDLLARARRGPERLKAGSYKLLASGRVGSQTAQVVKVRR